jgi:hypothetical protein
MLRLRWRLAESYFGQGAKGEAMSLDRSTLAASADVTDPPIAGGAGLRGIPWPLVLLGGLAGGVAWGIHARVWMRFISTDPQFTWSGTLFIVLGFGIAGLAQSAAYLGRRAGLRRSRLTGVRVAAFAGLLPLGAAAGGPVFPTIVIAPLALTHTEWSTRTRLLVGGIALIPVVAIAGILLDDLSVGRAAAGFVWFLGVYAGIVWAARFTMAPQRDGWKTSRRARALAVAALVVAAVLEFVFLVGPKA